MSEPGPSTIPMPNPGKGTAAAPIPPNQNTILQTLSSLLQTHQSRTHSQPYYHPYAPLISSLVGNGKGKERSGDAADIIRRLKEGVVSLREMLEKERDTERLSRALKEVTTHQTALLPSLTSLSSSPAPALPPFPSSYLLLSPTALLQTLSKRLGLEPFLEDSQFGLLKSSLAIAGSQFVVDVDLETDTLAGAEEGEEDDPMTTTTNTTTGGEESSRGLVRLSKLTANHVTKEGGTGKSDWIEKVLRETVESHLDLWNKGEAIASGDDLWEKEKRVGWLEEGLRDLKGLDETAGRETSGDVDWFEELEKVANIATRLIDDGTIYSSERNTIFPTFGLLPTESHAPSSLSNPTLRIRPARQGEQIPPSIAPTNLNRDGETSMDVDGKRPEGWVKGNWVLEVIPSEGVDGVVVRRGWLKEDAEDTAPMNGTKEAVSAGIRVENLLYRPFPQSTSLLSSTIQPRAFPYTGSFIHSRGAEKPEQHWSIAQPGPLAGVVGRVALPSSQEELKRVIEALRRQVVLNGLFTSVFKHDLLQLDAGETQDEEDDNVDDLLDGPQKAVPLTMTLYESSVIITFPRLKDGSFSEAQLVLKPNNTAPHYIESTMSSEKDQATESPTVTLNGNLMDLVEGLI
ncbi:hypothetical protein CI109_103635 [Kwoniella shandongensis]|uniref:Uncharacterized protein n=1 Tax=Kwoniella shandongensis TaxID=1734106 RepID=A0A5M6C881_9TREE|nr:uncharacterized protein CI109_000673 [Kwoniella shandongensis]KAA5531101.1 hypothetical protein CI109_000673 [Kwoniella shandongensis]